MDNENLLSYVKAYSDASRIEKRVTRLTKVIAPVIISIGTLILFSQFFILYHIEMEHWSEYAFPIGLILIWSFYIFIMVKLLLERKRIRKLLVQLHDDKLSGYIDRWL